ncbi:scopoletin glucosyltransferase-like [Iris pallida]|uniref:Scopoletin glucosyltransferase-like n=1 Tax=Iris pallida TaxID=29817 RepID=A0AAX6FSZ2_IRIPA|nr:scopoletin glucosyltransferase-like [Iris pallida]KAJ6799408.1 scopoletin glucosyltransferase-like [Iris pallida]KAJ6819168.1 scopoletin glucosyltransferase-like [Iris pallida]KAJ6838758.1 scopoletin glucosyltransferase-like [Iris pallida]
MGKARDDQSLRVRGEALEWPVAEYAVVQAEGEEAGAMEDEPRYAELSRSIVGPWEERVGHDAVGEELSQDPVELFAKPGYHIEELEEQVQGGDGRDVLAPFGQAGARREGDEPEADHWVAGAVGPRDERLHEGRVRGGGEDGGLDAAHGEELGHVERREDVALAHEGEEEHAEATTVAF